MEEYIYEKRKKNAIWIFADQLRFDAIGYNGDPNVNTPNIDRLATTGVSFNNAISGFPLCCPFRGSMITSQYPHKCVAGHEYPLSPNQFTIADVFNDNGYDTFYVGKWHLDGVDENKHNTAIHVVPEDRRGHFKRWIGYENNNSQFNTFLAGNLFGKEEKLKLEGFETDKLTDIFIDYLQTKKNEEEPFFGVLSVQPPHDPYVAPADFMGNYKASDIILKDNVPNYEKARKSSRRDLAGYYAQIENLDYNVGRIIEKLEKLDMLCNTHVIFFSDHGDMHGSHGMIRKTNPYNEAIKIPFIISGELAMPYGHKGRLSDDVDALINHVDIAPTTLGLCGIEAPKWMKGIDVSGYRLKKDKEIPVKDAVYLQNVIPTMHPDSIECAYRGIVTQNGYKYVSLINAPYMMFNLNEDPLELVNLVYNPKHKEKQRELHKRLLKMIEEKEDDFPIKYKV